MHNRRQGPNQLLPQTTASESAETEGIVPLSTPDWTRAEVVERTGITGFNHYATVTATVHINDESRPVTFHVLAAASENIQGIVLPEAGELVLASKNSPARQLQSHEIYHQPGTVTIISQYGLRRLSELNVHDATKRTDEQAIAELRERRQIWTQVVTPGTCTVIDSRAVLNDIPHVQTLPAAEQYFAVNVDATDKISIMNLSPEGTSVAVAG